MGPVEEVEFVDDDIGLQEGVVSGLAELWVGVGVSFHGLVCGAFWFVNFVYVLFKFFRRNDFRCFGGFDGNFCFRERFDDFGSDVRWVDRFGWVLGSGSGGLNGHWLPRVRRVGSPLGRGP